MRATKKQRVEEPTKVETGQNFHENILDIFPVELWDMVFEKLYKPSDLENLRYANPAFNDIVLERIIYLRMPEVLAILGRRFPDKFAKPCSAHPRVIPELLVLRSLSSNMRNIIDVYTDQPQRRELVKFIPLTKRGFKLNPYVFQPAFANNKHLHLPSPIQNGYLNIMDYPSNRASILEQKRFVSSFGLFADTFGPQVKVLKVVVKETTFHVLVQLFRSLIKMPNIETLHFTMEDSLLPYSELIEKDKKIAQDISSHVWKQCDCKLRFCMCNLTAFPRLPLLSQVILENCPSPLVKDVLLSNTHIKQLHICEGQGRPLTMFFKHYDLSYIEELTFTKTRGYPSLIFSGLYWRHIRILHINHPFGRWQELFLQLSCFRDTLEEMTIDLTGLFETGNDSHLDLPNLKKLYIKIYSMTGSIDFLSLCQNLEVLKMVLFVEPYSGQENITMRSVNYHMYDSNIWNVMPKLGELKIRHSDGYGFEARLEPMGNLSNGDNFDRETYREQTGRY